MRVKHEATEASARLADVCRVAWKYDNLRPTTLRAIAPVITPFRWPDVPVVYLSPGSPDYRRVVGNMMYWYWLYASRRQRLADFLAGQEAGAPPAGWALPQGNNEYEEDFDEDVHHVEGELDQAHASYGRACAWAWPYINLRPMCRQPGFEAATILNPFLPVPKIRLSEASPDYKETVAALRTWEPKIGNAKARLKDLLDDRKAAATAAKALAAAGLKIKPPDEKTPPEDRRLAEMFKIYEQIKPALRRWRKNKHKIEALTEPWYIAKNTLVALQRQAQEIQRRIASLEHESRNPKVNQARIRRQIQTCQNQLVVLTPQIARAKHELATIEKQVRELQADQAQLAGQTDALMEAWVHLCDVLGRLGPLAHEKTLPLLNQWIAEEPRLWQPYLARGVARLHVGQHDQALADLKRVESKLRLYDSRPGPLTLVMAVQAYALCKQKDTRDGDRLFATAKKLDKQSWAVCLIRGWSYLEREKYTAAKADFQMALRLSRKAPRAEAHEAMALLLAACPADRVRDGDKAVEYATKAACDLPNWQGWICFDTLGAAHAEAGDFDSALKWANKALTCAPAESQEPIRQRIALYQEKKPYRLK